MNCFLTRPIYFSTADVVHLEYHIGLLVRQDASRRRVTRSNGSLSWCRVGFVSWLAWVRKDPLEPGDAIGEADDVRDKCTVDWEESLFWIE